MSPFLSIQVSVSKMISGALSLSLLGGWQSIVSIWQTFNTWVRPPGRSFAVKAGGKGDLSDNLNEASPSCWKFDQDALTISSLSDMYPMAVIWLFWVRHSFCVACRYWLHCHISKQLWTLAILCTFLFSACVFILESFSVFVVYNAGLWLTIIPLLAWANWLEQTGSWPLLPKVPCLWFILPSADHISQQKKQASTPTPCGMVENISHNTLERSAHFECVSSCWHHQSVISAIQNELLISIGLEL